MTNVIFRKFYEGDVIALFPDEVANSRGFILSYQIGGQHGAASPELIAELETATRAEFQALLNELTHQVGYTDLTVIIDIDD